MHAILAPNCRFDLAGYSNRSRERVIMEQNAYAFAETAIEGRAEADPDAWTGPDGHDPSSAALGAEGDDPSRDRRKSRSRGNQRGGRGADAGGGSGLSRNRGAGLRSRGQEYFGNRE